VDFRPEFSEPFNRAARTLLTSLNDKLFSAASAPAFEPVEQRYSRCMASVGYDVAEPGALYDIAEQKVFSRINKFNATSKEYRAALPKAKAVEVRMGTADVRCRAPLADDIARLLSPTLDDWSARNSKKISEAAKGW